ncbi:hypothetical protein KAR91_56820 [Candidatus Pacearchaeota archaeon]|nr:hypothetical protein [Candidatus Pacearchaeota archaeon]
MIKRRSKPEMLLGRKAYRCEVCYPDEMYKESSEKMPIVTTIYVGRKKVKMGSNEVTLVIAWCAECNRWLAREKRWRVTMDDVDVATQLSDGKQGKGKMDWQQFVCMCDNWRKYCK